MTRNVTGDGGRATRAHVRSFIAPLVSNVSAVPRFYKSVRRSLKVSLARVILLFASVIRPPMSLTWSTRDHSVVSLRCVSRYPQCTRIHRRPSDEELSRSRPSAVHATRGRDSLTKKKTFRPVTYPPRRRNRILVFKYL